MSSSSDSSAPPPDDGSSSSSPPPPSDDQSPPSDNQSPPPPTSDNESPPPPSNNGGDGSSSSPPPSTDDGGDSSSPPPPSGDDDNSSSSPPPPPSANNDKSSPPPPPSKNDGDSQTPSPPSSKNHVPPPPPRSSSSSSSSSGSLAPPHSSSSSSSSGLSSEQKVLITVGISIGVGVLLVMFLVCYFCVCKRKKRRHQDPMHFYGGPPQGGQYYNSSQHPNWHQQGDHVVKFPLSPNSSGMPSGMGMLSSGGWPAQPPPPPPMMSSGEMNSANFSGPRYPPLPPPSPNLSLGFNKSTFTYDELAAATGGFAQANLIGQGGFGYVHKGVFPNGKEVAVKSLKTGSGQGEREFQAEVDIISRVHHRHLVSLVGYCIAGGQRMLVYEFVPNKTMEYHLHGEGRPTMDFPSRLRIALGSAKGLAYLHEDCHPRIIHRDIKAANILIDYNFEAMVADFGLAKLSSDTNTHVSTRVMGTFGYLAPEYAASGKLTEKSDVFSFGVMLLELITGKRPVDHTDMMEDSLVDWARPLMAQALETGNYDELVDPRLEHNYNPQEMACMVACAAANIRHSARRRPKMSQIARALEGDVSLEDLNNVGNKPGGMSTVYSSNDSSSDYDTMAYNADMVKFKKMAFTTPKHPKRTIWENTVVTVNDRHTLICDGETESDGH